MHKSRGRLHRRRQSGPDGIEALVDSRSSYSALPTAVNTVSDQPKHRPRANHTSQFEHRDPSTTDGCIHVERPTPTKILSVANDAKVWGSDPPNTRSFLLTDHSTCEATATFHRRRSGQIHRDTVEIPIRTASMNTKAIENPPVSLPSSAPNQLTILPNNNTNTALHFPSTNPHLSPPRCYPPLPSS